jgi:hypothetical protein
MDEGPSFFSKSDVFLKKNWQHVGFPGIVVV